MFHYKYGLLLTCFITSTVYYRRVSLQVRFIIDLFHYKYGLLLTCFTLQVRFIIDLFWQQAVFQHERIRHLFLTPLGGILIATVPPPLPPHGPPTPSSLNRFRHRPLGGNTALPRTIAMYFYYLNYLCVMYALNSVYKTKNANINQIKINASNL